MHLLDARREYETIVCLVRKRCLPRADRLDERVVDFDALLRDAGWDDPTLERIDDVFCSIGTTMKKAGGKEAFRRVDYDLPLRLAKLAVSHGAKRMALVSSVGADGHSRNFYLRTKGELEDALSALLAPTSALHVFRPSLLLGDRTESRPGEAIGVALSRGLSGLLFGRFRKYRPIEADHVARAMVLAMANEDKGAVYEHDAIEALLTASL
jgi:uncharacterized protein YbjT (DUF2867 family)